MAISSIKIKTSKKRVIQIILTLLLICCAISAYLLLFKNNDSSVSQPVSPINYGPPTEEEKASGDIQKEKNVALENLEKDNQTPEPDQGTPKLAQLTLVSVGQYENVIEVRAYVSNVYEDGGKCTATFTQGTSIVKVESNAFKDATTTQCGALDANRSQFTNSGNWQMTLGYSSSNAAGTLDPKIVTIQ